MLSRAGQLALLLATSLAALSAPPTLNSAALPAGLDADIAIVGAGVSGLSTALALAKQGHAVIVVEAMSRLGGRCSRAEAIPGSGIYWDEGGQWLGPTHRRMLALLRRYGLKLVPSPYATGSAALLWGNARLATNGTCWDCMALPKPWDPESIDGLLAAVAAAPDAMKSDLDELLAVMASFRTIVDSIDPSQPWNTPNAAELDSITFDEWVRRETSSELARRVMTAAARTHGSTNAPATTASALHIARQVRAAPQSDAPERWLVQGGAGQLPALMAADLESAGGKILLGAPVVAITHTSDSVTLQTASGARISAKRVVMALPPHLAGRVTYAPPLPPARELLTQRMGMGAIVKCVAVYDAPFWKRNRTYDSSTAAFVMDPAGPHGPTLGFDISPGGNTSAGILATFIELSAAEPWSLTAKGRKRNVLKGFVRMFGEGAAAPKAFLEKNWAAEPFVGGAYTSVMPMGAWTSLGPALTAPVGGIHWAGTEVSPEWPGFFEGALAAADAAAAAVHAELMSGDGIMAAPGVVGVGLSDVQ